MKRKEIFWVEFNGIEDHKEFVRHFNIQLLTELKKRSLLTEHQYQKGLRLLKSEK